MEFPEARAKGSGMNSLLTRFLDVSETDLTQKKQARVITEHEENEMRF